MYYECFEVYKGQACYALMYVHLQIVAVCQTGKQSNRSLVATTSLSPALASSKCMYDYKILKFLSSFSTRN